MDSHLTTTAKESACSWYDMHGMANMMQCNLSILIGVETPDKQIRVGVAFSTDKVKG
jgi:hypothetical protein